MFVAGKMVGMRVERSSGEVDRRYFHRGHLGSISTITNETGAVVERLSYDAWGKRRHPNGQSDPAGALTSQTSRGFTGHEQLDDVGLIHMNGRVYDPLIGLFGTPDPMTESPYSTQGWNRYTYVGNSPLNFTDPSGYCFMGCAWQAPFKAAGKLLNKFPILGQIVQIAATAICTATMGCSPLAVAALSSAVVTGLRGGGLGQALKAGMFAAVNAAYFNMIGDVTLGPGHPLPDLLSGRHLLNMAGHALVGCMSSVASGGKCGPGAAAGAAGSFSGPLLQKLGLGANVVAHSVVGGVASVAGGGKFGNGATTAAFGYLFNTLRGGVNGARIGGGISAALSWETGPLAPFIIAGGAFIGAIVGDWVTGPDVLWNENSGVILDDKIKGQLGDRGWTEQDVYDATAGEAAGTATDNRTPDKTPDGLGRNDPASVYGDPGGYVVVNDRTREVVQISDRTPWIRMDSR